MPRKPKSATNSTEGEKPGESISAYFRQIFEENPKLLKSRSNDELLARWLADHPGHTEVPQSVKNGMSNIKSVLRKNLRKRGRPKKEPVAETTAVAPKTAVERRQAQDLRLEELEVFIDEALTLARILDREGLESVIQHLRRAE